jgi:hypothetical protein
MFKPNDFDQATPFLSMLISSVVMWLPLESWDSHISLSPG